MGVFGKLFGAAIDVVTLPVRAVADVVMLPADASDGEDFMHRTTDGFKRIADKVTSAADEAAGDK